MAFNMYTQAQIAPTRSMVTVSTSARLHMGFFDLQGSATRKFGSLGLCIDAPCTQLVFERSDKTIIDANCSDDNLKIVENIVKSLKVEQKFSLNIIQSIPQHIGLGSGTQMALAIGAGLNQLFNLNESLQKIAQLSKRGRRSGIGIAAFEQGGILIDEGRIGDDLPKLVARIAFPQTWRVLLVHDSAHIGAHGVVELQAFNMLKPATGHLRDMVMQEVLPALQRQDLLAFGKLIEDLQAYNGAYFAPIQGGHYASNDVAGVLQWVQQNGVVCVGQSSWGPTGFAIVESEESANNMLKQLQQQFSSFNNISFQIVRGKNSGATIQSG